MISINKKAFFLSSAQLLNKSINFTHQKNSVGSGIKFDIDTSKFKFHYPEFVNFKKESLKVNDSAFFEKDRLLKMYKDMVTIRRIEIAADEEYKKKKIRGFLHLYDGEEAVAVGLDTALSKDDQIIGAYRCHGFAFIRGDSPETIISELFGKFTGSSKGKGGSMHFYNVKNNFFGGNGIVGAQVPLAVGVGFANAYRAKLSGEKNKNVSISLFGDGASNQGQIFESFNLAALNNVPTIYVLEDNKYGMGTSIKRSSAKIEYYTRGDFIPGIFADGMDVFSVYEATRAAKEYAISESKPIILHLDTYRYHGHSMSDAGLYRTKDEVSETRSSRDPITIFKKLLLEKQVFSEKELKEVESKIKKEMKIAVNNATKSNLPPINEIATDVYVDKEYKIRGRSLFEQYHIKQ